MRELKQVTSVTLADAVVRDENLATLAETMPQIEWLDLSNTDITDVGLDGVAQLANLQTLVINDTQITDAGLAKLAACPKLTTVYVAGTQVTPQGIKALQTALPGCTVSTDD